MSGKTIEDYTNQRIKHLEMIQTVIARCSDRSAGMKNLLILVGWTVFLGFLVTDESIFSITSDPPTISEVLKALGFLNESKNLKLGEALTRPGAPILENMKIVGAGFLIFILEAITLFCFLLDMSYFRRGEQFRKFYDRVREQPSGQRPDFCMTVPPDITKMIGSFRVVTLKSFRSTFGFYLLLILFYSFLTAAIFILSLADEA